MLSYFLDTSAFVKLYHQEPGSDYVERLAMGGHLLFVSRLALVEIESAISTKTRTGELDTAGRDVFRRRLRADLSQRRILSAPPMDEAIYQSARKLVASHGVSFALRTLDAIQLAVALRLQETVGVAAMVTADKRLCLAAEACGCPSIDPTDPRMSITVRRD